MSQVSKNRQFRKTVVPINWVLDDCQSFFNVIYFSAYYSKIVHLVIRYSNLPQKRLSILSEAATLILQKYTSVATPTSSNTSCFVLLS